MFNTYSSIGSASKKSLNREAKSSRSSTALTAKKNLSKLEKKPEMIVKPKVTPTPKVTSATSVAKEETSTMNSAKKQMKIQNNSSKIWPSSLTGPELFGDSKLFGNESGEVKIDFIIKFILKNLNLLIRRE